LPEPLPVVIRALQAHSTWDDMLRHLPDMPLGQANRYGLMEKIVA